MEEYKSEGVCHCGYMAIVGRPNVGKSTLLNRILESKLSITSPKPQTTRYPIVGIKIQGLKQIIYIDTPGLGRSGRQLLNRYMSCVAEQVLDGVDVVGFMLSGLEWKKEDEFVLEFLKHLKQPPLVILNKVDRILPKSRLLPHIDYLSKKMHFSAIIPISARTGTNVSELEKTVGCLMPERNFIFSEDEFTTNSQRFLASELIREKLMRHLREEIPYRLAVEIETFEEIASVIRISALIWVEKEGQKAVVIGHKGEQLRRVGQQSRQDMEQLFEKKIFLSLWVKVKTDWTNNRHFLRQLMLEGGMPDF